MLSLAEVEKHSTKESAWVIIHGNAFDVTEFLPDHPVSGSRLLASVPMTCVLIGLCRCREGLVSSSSTLGRMRRELSDRLRRLLPTRPFRWPQRCL